MKARGDILLTGAAGGTDPTTESGALLAFTKLASEPVVEVSDATGSEKQRGVTVTFRVNPPASKEVTVNFKNTAGLGARRDGLYRQFRKCHHSGRKGLHHTQSSSGG